MSAPARFERVWDAGPVAVDYLPGTGRDLVISFASVGHDPHQRPSPEFVGTAWDQGARHALFVSDESRSWANDPGFEAALAGVVARVASRAEIERIAAVGLSMGAFSALVAAHALALDLVLAFGPQYSVLPEHAPEETRWAEWCARLPAPRWPVAPAPCAGHAYLFHGAKDDWAQTARFAPHPRMDQVIFADQTHSGLVPHLKARGALAGLLEAGLAGDRRRLLRIAGSAGGITRTRFEAAQ